MVLIDFDNDCPATAVRVADALGDRLWGVRLDTSGTMVDSSLWEMMGRFDPRGVNPQLVWNVRSALDKAGFHIIASGMQQCLLDPDEGMDQDDMVKLFMSLA